MGINEKIIELIIALRKRPRMLIDDENINYNILKYFIEGYIYGLGDAYDRFLMRDITRWFEKRINMRLDVYWTNQIPRSYKKKTDSELKEIMLDTLELFFKENPEWYKA